MTSLPTPSPTLTLERERTCVDCGRVFHGLIGLCGDCGTARVEREQEVQRLAQQKVRKKRWLQMCPQLYQETDWANTALRPDLVKLARTWQPGEEKHSLLLMGDTGLGKTRVAFGLLQRFHEAGRSVYALHAGDAWDHGDHVQGLSSAVRLQYSEEMPLIEASRDCLRRARTCSLLLLDDLGKERASGNTGLLSEAVSEALFNLIEHRLTHRLPLIVTTNANGPALEIRLGTDRGPALLRRLSEVCTVVE